MNQLDWFGKAPLLTNIVLVVVLAQSLATVTWRLVPLDQADAPMPLVSELEPIADVGAKRVDEKSIAAWHLFGKVKKETAPALPAPVVEDVPDTQLRLTLMGVFASEDVAWAIIADHRGNEDTYRPGSKLPGGATLLEIYADRIILRHNNRRETLRLPRDELDNKQTISRTASRRSSSRAAPQPSGAVTTVSGEAVTVLRDYREKLLNDPQSVMSAVRAEPYRKGGKLMGYRVFPGADRQLMKKVGLQPGDVVTAVNGISLDSPLKGLEVMQNITSASEVTVNVLRNGLNQTFVVPMN